MQGKKPTECGDCHRIVGRKRDLPTTHRCLGCHAGNGSAIHARVHDDRARECLTCHNFMAPEQDPWRCASCHVAGQDVRQVEFATQAPKIEVHGSEWCGNCHVPHGQSGMEPQGCTRCHAQEQARHRKQELPDPGQCQECHVGHERGAQAGMRCVGCHVQVGGSAVFAGHDACTTCHRPHDQASPVKSCADCHGGTRTLGAPHVAEHSRCQSCHDPHRVRASPAGRCESCHDKVQVVHPRDAQRGACAACHPIHTPRARPVAAADCSSCHREARSDTAFHAGGTPCTSCHAPHGFSLPRAGSALCASCHGRAASARRAVPVTVARGHDDCMQCHRQGAHAPAAPAPDCGSCHRTEQQATTRGHAKCADCHTPHEGRVVRQCASCHAAQLDGIHAAQKIAKRASCQSCHRAHGPGGPAAPKPCTSCHDGGELPGMHQHGKHRDCSSCHGFHDDGLRRGRTACLQPCHTSMVNHEPAAQSCTGCHPFGGMTR